MKLLRNLWRDPDRRRALMLTSLAHLVALSLIAVLVFQPQLTPKKDYLVVDVGTPGKAQQANEASAARQPAPQTATPQVAASQSGIPQKAETKASQPKPAQTAGASPSKPQAQTAEARPSPKQAAASAKPPAPKAESTKNTESSPASSPPPSSAQEATQAMQPQKAKAAAVPPPVTAPVPAAHVPQTGSTPALPSPVTSAPEASTALPQIKQVELKPKKAATPLRIPQPQVATKAPQVRTVTAKPEVQVKAAKALPRPDVTSAVTHQTQPQAQAMVTAEKAVPQPQVQASVATAPQPDVQTSVAAAEAVPQPQVEVSTASATGETQPQVRASVAAAQAIPQPQAQTSVSTTNTASNTVSQPNVQASVAASQSVPQPQVQVAAAQGASSASQATQVTAQVSVAPGRSVTTSPQVALNASAVASPNVSASISQAAQAAAAGAPGEGVGAPGGSKKAAGLTTGLEAGQVAGGNAAQAGQSDLQAAAQKDALGAAVSPEGVANPSGAPAPKVLPYSESRERPLAVLLDNVKGYPQAGLKVASSIYEMPVEGGLTRLMTVYNKTDPEQVGPIRSARPYFVDLVESMKGVLVHDGGSPTAMAQIKRSKLPDFDALHNGRLFARKGARSAPYNLYASGTALRQAVGRLKLERSTPVSGHIFQPATTAEDASSLLVNYSATYKSGFTYLPKLNEYHWQRDGKSAVDASGNAVLVDAVVVAHIEAHPLPNDPAGRLYIPMRGGKATLYLHGKQLPGSWSDQGGFSFVGPGGKPIDLTPFKVWVLFAPQWAKVSAH
jgi:hypothetical protein